MLEVRYLPNQEQSVLHQDFYKKSSASPDSLSGKRQDFAVSAMTLSPNASFAAARRKVESIPARKGNRYGIQFFK